jgi:hypothetical protein
MTESCRSQPISFLRLERYLQGDVDAHEQGRVAAHLRECTTCRACFESLRDEAFQLPPLPLPQASPRVRPLTSALRPAHHGRPWARVLALSALAAAGLLAVRAPSDESATRSALHRSKGGELALELVREHAGSIAFDATHFAPGDRFEARLTCPPGQSVYAELVVFQASEVFFPSPPIGPLACANAVVLPAAFTLDGTAPVEVCVVTNESGPVDRHALTQQQRTRTLTAACCKLIEVDSR